MKSVFGDLGEYCAALDPIELLAVDGGCFVLDVVSNLDLASDVIENFVILLQPVEPVQYLAQVVLLRVLVIDFCVFLQNRRLSIYASLEHCKDKQIRIPGQGLCDACVVI